MTTMKCKYKYLFNNCPMMVVGSSTTVFYVHSYVNLIATHFFTILTMVPAIQKPTARMHVSIPSNLLFGHVFMVLYVRGSPLIDVLVHA